MVHLTEIRIVMPFTVEEFKRGQRYANWKTNENAQEPGQGGTLLSSTPYYDEVYGEGMFTHSLFRLGNRLPDWVNRLVPPSALVIDEKSWIVYPYMRTVITIPFFSRLKMEIVSIHKDDDGSTENALGLSEEELAMRKIDYMDLGSEKVAARDYQKELDPILVQPKATGRGPLTPGWQQREKTLMCAYKVVRAEANYWGLASRAEKLLINSLRQIFLLAHKNCFGLTDEWYHLTYDQVMSLERVSHERLNLAQATISGHDTALLEGKDAADQDAAKPAEPSLRSEHGKEEGKEEEEEEEDEEEEEEDYEDLDIEFYEAEMQWSLEEELYAEQMLTDGLGSKRYSSGMRSPMPLHLSPAPPVPAVCPVCAAGLRGESGAAEPALFCRTCSEFFCELCFSKTHCTPRLASHETQGIDQYKQGARLVNGTALDGDDRSKSEKELEKERKLLAKGAKKEEKEQEKREKRERKEQERRAKEEEKERERERKAKEKERQKEEGMIAKEMKQAKQDLKKEQKHLHKLHDGTSSSTPSPAAGPEPDPAQADLPSLDSPPEQDQPEQAGVSAGESDWAGMKNPPVNVPGLVRATSANSLEKALSRPDGAPGKAVLAQRSLSSKVSLQMNDEPDPASAASAVALSEAEALQLHNEFRGRPVELSQAILSEILEMYRSKCQEAGGLRSDSSTSRVEGSFSSATSSLSFTFGDRDVTSLAADTAAPDAGSSPSDAPSPSPGAASDASPPIAPATAAAPADQGGAAGQMPDAGGQESAARRGGGGGRGSAGAGWASGLVEFRAEDLEPLLASMGSENLRPASRFRALTEMLKEVASAALSHDEKLVFWINIYNALALHGFLVYGIPKSHYKRVMFLNKVAYVIGGISFSLLVMEHSVLRAASHRPALAGLLPVQRFKAGDPAFACILRRPEPLVTFALSCGSRSSPPVQVYSLQKLRDQLDEAASWYLARHVDLSSPAKVVLPKLLQWYGKDFAPSTGRLLAWIAQRLPEEKRQELESRMKRKSKKGGESGVAWEGGSKAVQVSAYDWTFEYLLGRPQELV